MHLVLLLDERILGDGTLARSWAGLAGERVRISDDGGAAGELSVAALDRVMCRYGRPLDPEIAVDGEVPASGEAAQLQDGRGSTKVLHLPGGYRLRRLRHHAPVDATGRDYLVWERPGQEPLAVVATMATAALRYLVLRIAGERPQESEG
jgi:hypothetical protein